MAICLLIAAVLGIASIFCFFGPIINVIPNTPNYIYFIIRGTMINSDIPSMLEFSLGLNGLDILIGMTSLFAIGVAIVCFCIFLIIYILCDHKRDVSGSFLKNLYIFSIILGILSLTATIMSFYTPSFVFGSDLKAVSDYVNLGIGPILYLVFQILIITLLIAGFIWSKIRESVYHKLSIVRAKRLNIKDSKKRMNNSLNAPTNIDIDSESEVIDDKNAESKKLIEASFDKTNTVSKNTSTSGKAKVKNNTTSKYCMYCGSPLKDDFIVCPKCGKPTKENKIKNPINYSDQKKKIELLKEYYVLYTKSIINEEDYSKIKEKILNEDK